MYDNIWCVHGFFMWFHIVEIYYFSSAIDFYCAIPIFFYMYILFLTYSRFSTYIGVWNGMERRPVKISHWRASNKSLELLQSIPWSIDNCWNDTALNQTVVIYNKLLFFFPFRFFFCRANWMVTEKNESRWLLACKRINDCFSFTSECSRVHTNA